MSVPVFEVGTTIRGPIFGIIYTRYPNGWHTGEGKAAAESLSDECAANYKDITPPSAPLSHGTNLDHSKRYVHRMGSDSLILVWDYEARLWQRSDGGLGFDDFAVDTDIEEIREIRDPVSEVARIQVSPSTTSWRSLEEANASRISLNAEIASLKADREAFRKELNAIHVLAKEQGDPGVGTHVDAVRAIISRLRISNESLAVARQALDEAQNENRQLRNERQDVRLIENDRDRLESHVTELIHALGVIKDTVSNALPSRFSLPREKQ